MKLSKRIARAWRVLKGLPESSQRAYFAGASVNRLTADWFVASILADEEVRANLRLLRGRARELARNDALIGRYLQLAAVNVVGPNGITIQPKVKNNSGAKAENINATIKENWNRWYSGPVSVDGQMGGVELEQLAYKTRETDGETFVRLHRGWKRNPYGLALELIDADLLDETWSVEGTNTNNEIRMGVEIDAFGVPVAYHFRKEPRYITSTAYERIRIPASEILHIFRRNRPHQTRGYTRFHGVMLVARNKHAYQEAEVYASRYASSKPVVLEANDNVVLDDEGNPKAAQTPTLDGSFGSVDRLYGWNVKQLAADHPTTAFEAFCRSLDRGIAMGLGVSYPSLTGDYSQSNFSSSRMDTVAERDNWSLEQQLWISHWERPIYSAWLQCAILEGMASGGVRGIVLDSRNPAKFLDVDWKPRDWSYINPLQDIQALQMEFDAGISCRTDHMDSKGGSFEENLKKLAAEQKLAASLGVDLKTGGASAPPAPAADQPDDAAPDEPPEPAEPADGNGKKSANRIGPIPARSRW